MSYDYEMPDRDQHILRSISGTNEDSPIPAKLEDHYWQLKRCADRIGAVLNNSEMAFLCYLLGYGKPTKTELDPPDILELVKKKQIKTDDAVEVEWQDGISTGLFRGVSADRQVKVLLDGDTEIRKVSPAAVRKIDQAELAVA